MAILVTGGSGMIASRIVRNLVRRGEDVIAHDLNIDEELLNYVMTEEERGRVQFVQGDILDYERLIEVCRKNNVDKIIHTASMMGNAKNPLTSVQINTGGMMRILEIARILNVKKVVYSSTNSVFDTQVDKVYYNDEPFAPDTLYGCTKAFNEYVAELYHRLYGLDITGIRISALVFGPLQRRGISGSIAMETLQKPAVGEKGCCPYNDYGAWIYVEDVVKAHILALDTVRKGDMAGCYNIAGTVVPFEKMGEFSKSLIPDAVIEFKDKDLGQVYWNVNQDVARKELGYEPDWDVFDAFKETINECRKAAGMQAV